MPLNGEQTLLKHIYGLNRDNELVAFYLSLLQTIVKNDFDTMENIIMGGDFNCPLNPTVDKRGGNLFPRQSVINIIEDLQSELDLHDISKSLADNVCSVDIIPSIKTDHTAILIEFQGVDAKAKGPGIWKLNCSLLSDETCVEKINSLIPRWVQQGENDLEDPR